MMFKNILSLAFLFVPFTFAGPDPCAKAKASCANHVSHSCDSCQSSVTPYIVVLNPTTDSAVKNSSILNGHVDWLTQLLEGSNNNKLCESTADGFVGQQFTIGSLIGYSGTFNQDVLAKICSRGDVKYVEYDVKISTKGNSNNA
ncbi:hypothetical protein BB560_000307 [Smittium megazygosporum]|uniref:Inhibitor I9 domain-containing protein n=1 Tax=Smittium megazygosporum TaxID=133381 RepID=A0A2T9ZKR5_9FUNG|nr:hypothetical protein BB560_000307 [Smittium megazygosporum]